MIGCLLNIRLRAKCKGLGILPKSPRVRTAAVLAVLSNPSFLRPNAVLSLRAAVFHKTRGGDRRETMS